MPQKWCSLPRDVEYQSLLFHHHLACSPRENSKGEVARLSAEFKTDADIRNKIIRLSSLDPAQYSLSAAVMEVGKDKERALLHNAAERWKH